MAERQGAEEETQRQSEGREAGREKGGTVTGISGDEERVGPKVHEGIGDARKEKAVSIVAEPEQEDDEEDDVPVEVRICGWLEKGRVILSRRQPDSRNVERAFLTHFKVQDNQYEMRLYWHFRHEPCEVHRSIRDLSNMARNTPQLLVDSESIQLHAHRAVQARRRQIIPATM
ncbi:hypothetical protein LTR56_005910 [Elasticomyces elasticus]|nr:hypothetical protein LTR56_005910 [Elasticomyces elasticus]KAK3664865.1 hypothetical protein LTR22_004171 [Elasticomyces elasticus]KAK4912751.1 hypothetical protein LTR49_018820 [Elasticomyces elasticus]KAK5752175.1 hypothetical protein LTS12_017770 [Elasticomyces elasticus]